MSSPLTADDARHGTPTGYINHNCRCGPCIHAGELYRAEREPGRYRALARSRAMASLKRSHRNEYDRLVRQELERFGLR